MPLERPLLANATGVVFFPLELPASRLCSGLPDRRVCRKELRLSAVRRTSCRTHLTHMQR